MGKGDEHRFDNSSRHARGFFFVGHLCTCKEKARLFMTSIVQDVCPLTWQQRGWILKDACRGLAWLHGSKTPMIHQDVKS